MRNQIAILIALIGTGCHSQQASRRGDMHNGATTREVSGVPRGMARYAYTVTDDAGTSVIKGTMTLPDPLPQSGSFEGAWVASYSSNDEMPPTAHLGPQTGEGKISGTIENGWLNLSLNPGMADSNVRFQIDAAPMTGTWTYSGYAGAISHGTISVKHE